MRKRSGNVDVDNNVTSLTFFTAANGIRKLLVLGLGECRMELSGVFIEGNILFPEMTFSLIGVNLGLLRGGMGVGVEGCNERSGLEAFYLMRYKLQMNNYQMHCPSRGILAI